MTFLVGVMAVVLVSVIIAGAIAIVLLLKANKRMHERIDKMSEAIEESLLQAFDEKLTEQSATLKRENADFLAKYKSYCEEMIAKSKTLYEAYVGKIHTSLETIAEKRTVIANEIGRLGRFLRILIKGEDSNLEELASVKAEEPPTEELSVEESPTEELSAKNEGEDSDQP